MEKMKEVREMRKEDILREELIKILTEAGFNAYVDSYPDKRIAVHRPNYCIEDAYDIYTVKKDGAKVYIAIWFNSSPYKCDVNHINQILNILRSNGYEVR
jgi:hypothetical protein